MAKIFLSRNLAFLLAERRPPHSTPDVRHRLLFCFFFFDRFLEGIFSIFVHFWASLGTPKIVKNRLRKPSSFRGYAFHAFLTNFSLFGMILRMQNVCISLAGPTKYAFSPKMSFDSPGTDFGSILAVFGVPGGA